MIDICKKCGKFRGASNQCADAAAELMREEHCHCDIIIENENYKEKHGHKKIRKKCR